MRLRDLCDRLEIEDEDQQRMMWTCLEHVLVKHTDLMMDRHLDQILMCAVYVMAKVTYQLTLMHSERPKLHTERRRGRAVRAARLWCRKSP